ncbi:MAG: endonuclease MutS2 [Bacteroidetes bacterium HGW-Bacteroidetes-19]|nr:MAG: endonuclease MutS2 [Bacteroidetes bacterium HGW-Bacteroidetes-19]
MIYPNNFEQKIGFDVIRNLVKEKCISQMGRERVDEIQFTSDFETLNILLQQTDQFKSAILFDDSIQVQDFYDIRPTLSRIHIDGTFAEIDEIGEIRAVITAIINIVVYFRVKNDDQKYPHLWELCKDIILEKDLLEAINKIIDPKGQLRDNASEELRRIRREIIKISGEADRKIKKLLNIAKKDGLVKEDAEMTIRNGRLCIPVPAQFKRKLHGFIHDESATGQTVFIEPTDVFDANNELRDLLNAERREIIRILTETTSLIRFSLPNLHIGLEFLGLIDFIRAKALFSISINGILPKIFDNQIIKWGKAIHPILFLNFKNSSKEVVPLDIDLEKDSRILIISGPNAGGKSVCLKTVGLLQYMIQNGLLVPMQEYSEMGVFDSFFINMGDEQSIDNDLSTYSSHLRNLKTMIEHLESKSLFLIDEFGSGTEPTLGGAMAEAILERIYGTGSFGIITTHYGNLKMFSETHPQATNGAMLFDTTALKPLFILKQGKPGSSFTYEIARQIGFPEEIIASAISKSGTSQIDYEKVLEEVELEKMELDKQLRMVSQTDEKLAEIIDSYSLKFQEFDKQRKEILQKAKNQALTIIDSANQMIEKTIREIKEVKAETSKTKEIRQNVQHLKEELKKEINSVEKEESISPIIPIHKTTSKSKPHTSDETPIKVGDSVFITDIQTIGEVTKINGNEVTLSFNSISLKTSLSKLVKISKKEARNVKRTGLSQLDGTRIGEVMNEKVAHFKTNIDVRGERADAAIQIIESFIDEAVLLNVHQLKILHGKGDGILRKVIRQYLSKRREIRKFEDEVLELGGCGITIVEL